MNIITLTIIGILFILVFLPLYILNELISYKRIYKTSHTETISELMNIIEYKCMSYTDNIVIQLQNKSINTTKEDLINNAKAQEIISIVSTEILLTLSKDFTKKLSLIIDKKRIEIFIIELIYDTMIKLINDKNLKAIKKYK